MAQAKSGVEPVIAQSSAGLGDPKDPHQSTIGKDSRPSSLKGVAQGLSREFEDSHPQQSSAAASDEPSTLATALARSHGTAPTSSTNMERDDAEMPRTTAAHADEKTSQRVASVSDAGSRPAASDEVTIGGTTGRALSTEPFDNGYHFPPKFKWQEATRHNLASFWKFFITPMGFFWTVYGLNVVAWGGMLFLLLCNAAPAMCHPSCDDIDSPRRIWVEIDSQILTVLFCVPAFGFAPWRFRDLWYVLKYRLKGDQMAIRRLGAIHVGWFRLKGSQELAVDIGPGNIPDSVPRERIPFPESSIAAAPLSGTRAPATPVWKMDFVVWCMVLNTFAQCGLCGIMWGMNRYNRPSWSTGFLVAVGCIIAMVGGYAMFLEGKRVKSIEGVPLAERDLERLARDKELGIPHYNNIKDKKPKQKRSKGKN